MTFCKTVWLIDDDEMNNFMVEKNLELNNFASEVRLFLNAKEALSQFEIANNSDKLPEFLFLDLNMPKFDGWDFLNHFRKLPKEIKEKTTLYILSSSIDEEDINRSRLYEDVRDFLSKPLSKMDLEVVKFQAKPKDVSF